MVYHRMSLQKNKGAMWCQNCVVIVCRICGCCWFVGGVEVFLQIQHSGRLSVLRHTSTQYNHICRKILVVLSSFCCALRHQLLHTRNTVSSKLPLKVPHQCVRHNCQWGGWLGERIYFVPVHGQRVGLVYLDQVD